MFDSGRKWYPSFALLAAFAGLMMTVFQIGIEFYDRIFLGADKAFDYVKINNITYRDKDKANFYVPDNSDVLTVSIKPAEGWHIVSAGYRKYIPNNTVTVPFTEFSLSDTVANSTYGTTFSITMRKGEKGKEHTFYINVRRYTTLTVDFNKLVDNQSKIFVPVKGENGQFSDWNLTYISEENEKNYAVFDSPEKLAGCLHSYIGFESPYDEALAEKPYYEFENGIFTYKGCISDDIGEITIEY